MLWVGILKGHMLGKLPPVTGSNVLVHIFADIWPMLSLGDSLVLIGQHDLRLIVIAANLISQANTAYNPLQLFLFVTTCMKHNEKQIKDKLHMGMPQNGVCYNSWHVLKWREITKWYTLKWMEHYKMACPQMNGVLWNGTPWNEWSDTYWHAFKGNEYYKMAHLELHWLSTCFLSVALFVIAFL